MLLAADVVIFLAVFLVVMSVGRIAEFRYDYTLVADILAERRRKALDEAPLRRLLDPLVVGLSIVVRRLGLAGLRARVQHELMQAGNPWGYRPEEYIAWSMSLALVVGGGVAGALLVTGRFNVFFPLLATAIVYLATMQGLKSRGDRRRVELERQLPYFLDLTSLSMGAGATFLQACESAIQRPTKGPLEEEVELMLREIQAGTPMGQALQNMTKRIESAELAQMIQAVHQGEELGTPLVRVFEQQADLNRYRRSKRGEQIAAKLPNRLAVPTVFLMLAVFLLLFGPIIIKATRGGLA